MMDKSRGGWMVTPELCLNSLELSKTIFRCDCSPPSKCSTFEFLSLTADARQDKNTARKDSKRISETIFIVLI
jgi:hypothetical protein